MFKLRNEKCYAQNELISNLMPATFSNVNDRIMQTNDAVLSEGPKTTGIQQRSLTLSLTHRDFSSFSEYFMMLCTVHDEICKAFAIWQRQRLFLKYSIIILRTLSQIEEPLPIFTSERLCFSKTSLLQLIMLQTWCQLT